RVDEDAGDPGALHLVALGIDAARDIDGEDDGGGDALGGRRGRGAAGGGEEESEGEDASRHQRSADARARRRSSATMARPCRPFMMTRAPCRTSTSNRMRRP